MNSSRAWPHQVCLMALAGEQHPERGNLTTAQAAAWLAEMYGQDFGEDYARWKAWLRYNWMKRVNKPAKPTAAPKPKLRPRSG